MIGYRRHAQRHWAMGLGTVATVLLGTGCTMCPDPFDYSGPVPNGTAPQNNFRVRSQGILPIGRHPGTWPPFVEKGTPPEATVARYEPDDMSGNASGNWLDGPPALPVTGEDVLLTAAKESEADSTAAE
jgi:hypothetical protein